MPEDNTQILISYFFAINIVTFFVYGIDKWKAKRSRWRIHETTLLGLAIIGGSIGAWLGMEIWHHKTVHKKFKYGLPIILLIQVALFIFCSCGTKQKITPLPHIQNKEIAEHSSSVFIVMYDAETGKAPLLKAIRKYDCEVIYDYRNFNGMAVRKSQNMSLEETMQLFRKVKGVLSVNYDNVYHLTDPIKPKQELQ